MRDDGNGLDPDHVNAGRGLLNMRARAHRLGADLSITAASPGTSVILQLGMPASPSPIALRAPDAAAPSRSP